MKNAPIGNTATSAAVPGPVELHPHEWSDSRASAQALRAAQARQVSGRRRFVDPATCEREYTNSEVEFMHAMQDYKHSSGRMFPTWSEVLEVLVNLGYEKPADLLPSMGDSGMRRVAAG